MKYCGFSVDDCGPICYTGLTAEEKKYILDKHNEYRAKVANGLETQSLDGATQPKAANMLELVWNDEAAVIAQV